MNSNNYIISRLGADNIADLDKLHYAVYQKQVPRDFFLKKYDTAYTGIQYNGFIAYNSHKMPVAFYGVIPCLIVCSNEVIMAAQSADTMTHPGYRSRGLFVQLAELTFELCRITGIRLLFGFPNQNSLPGFVNKLGWCVKEYMDCFLVPVKCLPLERLSIKLPFLKGIYNYYVKQVIKKYYGPGKGIANPVLVDGFDGILRNNDYLEYKTYSVTHVIEIDGVAFWIKINNGLIIGDIAGITDYNLKTLMDKLLKIGRRVGVKQIQFHTSPCTKLHTLFIQQYEAIRSFPVILKDLDGGVQADNLKFAFADIDIF